MEVVVEPGLRGERVHEAALQDVVGLVSPHRAEPGEDPPRVGIDHEEALAGGVERDRIGGLAPDAGHGRAASRAARQGSSASIASTRPPYSLAEKVEERAQSPRLDVEAAGGADEGRDLGGGQVAQRGEAREGRATGARRAPSRRSSRPCSAPGWRRRRPRTGSGPATTRRARDGRGGAGRPRGSRSDLAAHGACDDCRSAPAIARKPLTLRRELPIMR